MIPDFSVSTFHGLNTFIKDLKTLRPGVASSSNNWITGKYGDHIELRRGSQLLGQTRQTGAGKITGLGVGTKKDGSQIPFFTYGKKAKYYDAVTDDMIEISSDLLGTAANGEDTWIAPYTHLAGYFVYLGSPNSGMWKVPLSNPGSAVSQQATSRFGFLRFGQGRAFAARLRSSTGANRDDTSMFLSYIDKSNYTDYTAVTGEVVGALGSTTYSGTLSAITGKRTAFLVVIAEAGGETIIDNGDGTLSGNQGSSGTINYATGAYSVTFNHTTTGAVTADYRWEDSTSAGVMDFTFSSPRTAGQGEVLLQSASGNLMAIFPFLNLEYAFHKLRTWQFTTSLDDTDATNLPYRNIGIPYQRAACETPEGILLIDTSNPSQPKVRKMQILQGTNNTTIEPVSLSEALDLSGHAFDYAVVKRWGDYEVICCQDYTNAEADPFNSVMYMRNVVSGAWDKLSAFVSCLEEYEGTLIVGDSIGNNVFTLFSGFDDDDSPIENHWQDGKMNLGTDNLKRVHRMVVKGLIQSDQNMKVSLAYDDGDYVEVFTIEGGADYVDSGINVSIGSPTIGSKVIGGGGESTAHPFEVDFPVHSDRFQYVSVKFEATDIGYAEIDSYTYKDIRDKGRKSLATKTI